MLLYAVISINLALVFYSVGVWGEKIQGILKKWHLAVFWAGLAFDTVGTSLMGRLAEGGFKFNFHGITGLLAIVLMLVHAVWASYVLLKNDRKSKSDFHKFSIVVWIIWLIPFISGAVMGMSR
ncbi:hypothetical protein CLHUN_17250 [Ruminiclostridium hungatei]|uniref:TIGR03987 family protein n=1 Tax=Ruminiclostridium hungatei TaxID=48256 RepID=A0A1V4SLP7_RUMHU|nr:HsmA family protein [Ruminiclostridium hungatei]OPX44426.1 hypothetical protein CLHUN_17250 [Ruminiclostridium hungatei]